MYEDDSLKSPVVQTGMGGEIDRIAVVLHGGYSVAATVAAVDNVAAAVAGVGGEGSFGSIEVHRMVKSTDRVGRVRREFVGAVQVLKNVVTDVGECVNRIDAVARGDMQRMTLNCKLPVDRGVDHPGWISQTRHRTELAVGGEIVRAMTDRMQQQTTWAPLHLDGVLKSCFLEKKMSSAPLCENSSKRKKNEVVVVVVRHRRVASSGKNAIVRLSGR